MEQKSIPQFLTTNELADSLKVRPATIRRGYCVKGNYLGLVPKKLPNGSLRWPMDKTLNLLEV